MMHRMALPLLAFVVAGGCSGSDATSPLTSPNAVAAVRQADAENDGATSQRSGALYVTKNCSSYHGLPGEYCTITSSNLKEIPVDSRVVYETGVVAGSLNSDLILYPAGRGNQIAFGHVVLDLATGTGVVTFSGGTGKFKKFQAKVDVSIAPSGRPNFVWDGTYSFSNKGEED